MKGVVNPGIVKLRRYRKVTYVMHIRVSQGYILCCDVEGHGYMTDAWSHYSLVHALRDARRAYRARFGKYVVTYQVPGAALAKESGA